MPQNALRFYNAGQVTRRTGATPRQLRYWDQIGIAIPTYQRTRGVPGVPRLYSPEDVLIVARINYLLRFAIPAVSLQRFRAAVEEKRRGGWYDPYPDAVLAALDVLELKQVRDYRLDLAGVLNGLLTPSWRWTA